jgi:hypothetical protein
MAERPIIFTAESVRAILDGRKTQTRRVIKPQPIREEPWLVLRSKKFFLVDGKACSEFKTNSASFFTEIYKGFKCPYGVVGDRLWVRETYWDKGYWKTDENFKRHWVRWLPEETIDFYYDADGEPTEIRGSYSPFGACIHLRKHPAIHMMKKYARLWLEITGIRVERVQDIGEEDAKAEGVAPMTWINHPKCKPCYTVVFSALWDSLNAKRGYGWESNPWVWCLNFRKVKDG